MICEIICVAGFLCMSNLDIVHISSAYVHIICILSEHMCIMRILSAVVLDIFLPNKQCQCDLLNLLILMSILPTVWRFYSTSYLFFPLPFLPLPLPPAGLAVVVVFLCLMGVAPSISATSSSFLLDPPLASLDLPGLLGCFFLVINLLNGVTLHLNSAAQPVWDGLKPVICSLFLSVMLRCERFF